MASPSPGQRQVPGRRADLAAPLASVALPMAPPGAGLGSPFVGCLRLVNVSVSQGHAATKGHILSGLKQQFVFSKTKFTPYRSRGKSPRSRCRQSQPPSKGFREESFMASCGFRGPGCPLACGSALCLHLHSLLRLSLALFS